MEFIRDLIETLSTGWGDRLGVVFPLLLAGLVGLYLLWLIVGYLRVSQVGIGEGRGHAAGQEAVQLARGPEGTLQAPPGLPYCAVDGLQYPAGARFCTLCERDLVLDCATCGATLDAADASCYRCGAPTRPAAALPG